MAIDMWFTELEAKGHGKTFRVDRMLVDIETPFQKLKIFENESVGRVMLLDDAVMLTQRDEHIYHEMLVHPALLAHPDPKDVLVVGGGDGGTLREVVKHPSVVRAVQCEIDQEVMDYSRKYLPFTACGMDHPKAEVVAGDAIEYIRNHENSFDVVIVDSTDPVGFAEGLFRGPFYRDVKKALRPGGIMVQQTESPLYEQGWWDRIYEELHGSFANVHCYWAVIPMYPSSFWSFGFASDDRTPWQDFDAERGWQLPRLKYYTPAMQQAAFVLPKWANRALREIEEDVSGD
jgi:spermidine synthase